MMNQTQPPQNGKPLASLSLDLDNEWAYLKTHGNPAWESYPSYLSTVVPRMLHVLAHRKLLITVFVVGQDAALEYNHEALAQIASAGHEIGNHSLRHDPWLHLFSEHDLEQELAEAERHIQAATGQKPIGFRGPGYSQSSTMLRVLARRGYAYDASSLPSFIGPIARAYYFATGQFNAEQRERLNRLFGSWKDGLRPLKPYRWRLNETSLLEMPVTTFPGIRIPIHLSYVMYLAGFSTVLAQTYFNTALWTCRLFGVEPSILLHPLDFLGGEDVPRLQFFPSMRMSSQQKIAIVERCLDSMVHRFDVRSVGEHAAVVATRKNLMEVEPND
ncbi:polysaccharide deacetylase family protein [Nitrosomonas sp.]|uniref:polysaccharide deacetylase family protein n=1 Tax=Nitrosomonas sp. TaxID=42353 RepID=UPI0025E03BC2|nr:polysaccharide deacetylase family protein [Nitrosomonas sp.]MBY0483004.1 polysaccharide deacetylase family protein [Nitrosomonas sp.]